MWQVTRSRLPRDVVRHVEHLARDAERADARVLVANAVVEADRLMVSRDRIPVEEARRVLELWCAVRRVCRGTSPSVERILARHATWLEQTRERHFPDCDDYDTLVETMHAMVRTAIRRRPCGDGNPAAECQAAARAAGPSTLRTRT